MKQKGKYHRDLQLHRLQLKGQPLTRRVGLNGTLLQVLHQLRNLTTPDVQTTAHNQSQMLGYISNMKQTWEQSQQYYYNANHPCGSIITMLTILVAISNTKQN